jgi:hypothetical protein
MKFNGPVLPYNCYFLDRTVINSSHGRCADTVVLHFYLNLKRH